MYDNLTINEKTAVLEKTNITIESFAKLSVDERATALGRSTPEGRAQLLDRAPAQEKVAIFERATPAAERLQMFDRALVERMNIANEKSTPAMEKASATN
jgi:hypothetical protein